jgi:hypothetical protein
MDPINENKDLENTSGTSREKGEIEETEDWMNDHGGPDFEYLESLAKQNSPESLERLQLIAEDLDIAYDADTSVDELIGKIRTASTQNEEVDPNVMS